MNCDYGDDYEGNFWKESLVLVEFSQWHSFKKSCMNLQARIFVWAIQFRDVHFVFKY